MDLKILQQRVQESRLLTESEKSYWVQNLAKMNTVQIARLEAILDEAEKLLWSPAMQDYLTIASKAGAALAAA